MRIKIFLKLGLGFFLGFLLVKLASSNQLGLATKPVLEKVLPVRGYVLKSQTFVPTIRALAEVRSLVRPDIASEIAGKVTWVHSDLREGACFAKDTLIVQIEDQDYALEHHRLTQLLEIQNQELSEIDVLERELIRSGELIKDNLEVSNKELNRQIELARNKSVPEGNIDPFQRASNQSGLQLSQWESEMQKLPIRRKKLNHQVENLKAQVALAQLKLARSSIKTPFAGCVVKKAVHTGQWVGVGQTLVQVESNQGRELLARFAEEQALKVQGPYPGWKVLVANEHMEEVLSINPVGNPISRAREAIISLRHNLTPASMLEVLIQAPAKESLLLPQALCMDSTVLILNGDGVLENRNVKLGATDSFANVEVIEGLKEGDVIVEESEAYAKPGLKAVLVGKRS